MGHQPFFTCPLPLSTNDYAAGFVIEVYNCQEKIKVNVVNASTYIANSLTIDANITTGLNISFFYGEYVEMTGNFPISDNAQMVAYRIFCNQ